VIREGFAGPGGVSVALARLGLRSVGLEWDAAACATRGAAGHTTIRCDIAAYPTAPWDGLVEGSHDSPPCQPWSRAGARAGLEDQPLVHQAVHDLAHGRDTRAQVQAACTDSRSVLAAEPMRWHHAHRPAWITMEQVPDVLPLWRQYAQILRGWGYSTWAGILNAADYGVPQARRRAIIIASRVRTVAPPAPTHTQHPAGESLFGDGLPYWITMADALGWGYTDRPAPTVTGGGTATGGPEPFGNASRRAMRAAMNDPGHWAWRRPAPTITGTVGHVGGRQADGHLNLSLREALALQGFPDGYPVQGNKGQAALQIGNAVPPPLGAAVGCGSRTPGSGRAGGECGMTGTAKAASREWTTAAACRAAIARGDADHDVMFPANSDDEGVAAAKALCRGCPVTRICLTVALVAEGDAETRDRHGICGGLTGRDRRRLYLQHHPEAAAGLAARAPAGAGP
jgi:DNA (cytosine-5)-methyltransferase 1